MTRVIAISGGSGSGKSTLASALLDAVGPTGAEILPLDAYYHDLTHLGLAERARVNFDHPDALDLPLFRDHLVTLKSGEPVRRPEYDFSSHCRLAQPVTVMPRTLIVVEGILVASTRELSELYDFLIFVETDRLLRWQRRLVRDQRERGREATSIASSWERAEQALQHYGGAARGYANCVVSGEAPASESATRVLQHVGG
jgi:uridine kinase